MSALNLENKHRLENACTPVLLGKNLTQAEPPRPWTAPACTASWSRMHLLTVSGLAQRLGVFWASTHPQQLSYMLPGLQNNLSFQEPQKIKK